MVKALEHVTTQLAGMSLHDRLAIVVPSAEFADALWGPLDLALAKHFHPTRRFKLVDAITASQTLAAPRGHEPTAGEDEWLLLSDMTSFDGLERLIVVAIGLDSCYQINRICICSGFIVDVNLNG